MRLFRRHCALHGYILRAMSPYHFLNSAVYKYCFYFVFELIGGSLFKLVRFQLMTLQSLIFVFVFWVC